MAVFGTDYIADSAIEVFYIREKPVVPQPGDGVIKVPAPGQMQFSDGFKVDVTGHGVTAQRILKDLPSKLVISCQRRRVSCLSTSSVTERFVLQYEHGQRVFLEGVRPHALVNQSIHQSVNIPSWGPTDKSFSSLNPYRQNSFLRANRSKDP